MSGVGESKSRALTSALELGNEPDNPAQCGRSRSPRQNSTMDLGV